MRELTYRAIPGKRGPVSFAWTPCIAALGVALVASACSSGDVASASDRGSAGQPPVLASGGAGPGQPGNEPEVEVEENFRAPVTTGKFLWTANPFSNRVALINAETFEVRTVEAGFEPTYLAPLPTEGEDIHRTLVLNVRSQDASLLTINKDARVTSAEAPVHAGANSWAVREDGEFAIAWTNSGAVATKTAADGFQDITVLRIDGESLEATRLTVGYRPSQVVFSGDGERALAVTESGVSVVRLGASPGVIDLVSLGASPAAGVGLDVSLTPSGSHALVRTEGSNVLQFVELATGDVTRLSLPGAVTDLDVSADGKTAVAVLRDVTRGGQPAVDASVPELPDHDGGIDVDAGVEAEGPEAPQPVTRSEVVFLPLPEIFTDDTKAEFHVVPASRVGSVALTPDAGRAVLYLTSEVSSGVTVVSRAGEFRSLDLRATVTAVFPTDDGTSAVVLQQEPTNAARPGAFSVVPLTSNRAPRIEATVALPHSIALLPSTADRASDRALITVSSGTATGAVHAAYLVDTDKLGVESVPLSARPLATGVVGPVNRGFIAQAHPEGLITFIGLDDADLREITGFELASKVVNE